MLMIYSLYWRYQSLTEMKYLILGECSQAAVKQQLLNSLQAKSYHLHVAITYKAKGHCISK